MNRTEALEQIVTFGTDRENAYSALAKYGFDSEVEYFVVSKSVLESVLTMYLTDQITADELEQWANFVECRADLNYEAIEDYIYAIANPYLVGEINKDKMRKMVQVLNAT
ncbi:hypothetical protein [Shewanella sp. cp20]|uniref:hypothetical protein n=1 Tax=Shewanella sp. cp20 TaxID=1521167 RepID=UPI00059FF01B|nr:hypothetical protein [Shewanella sp. cp20]KIO37614.1 hypothetical protein DB48_04350 [Shewanella sp. cp20]